MNPNANIKMKKLIDNNEKGINVKPIIFALFLLLLVIFSLNAADDYDIWWHLKTGEYIVKTHSLLSKDIFSYASSSHWIAYSWLAEILYYLGVSTFGFNFLVVVRLILYLATFGTGAFVLFRLGNDYISTIVVSSLLAFLAAFYWTDRPYLFSAFFLMVIFLILLSWEKTYSGLIWMLPPIMLIWVNMHINFAFGLALIIFFALYDLLRMKFRYRNSGTGADNRVFIKSLPLYLSSAVSIALTFVNPYKWDIYSEVFKMANMPVSYILVPEFASPDFHALYGRIFLIAIILSCIILAASPQKPDLRSILIYLIILGLSLYSTRNTIFLTVLWLPIVSYSASALMMKINKSIIYRGRVKNKIPSTTNTFSPRKRVVIYCFAWLMVAAFIVISVVYQIRKIGLSSGYANDKIFPVHAVEYLEAHDEIKGRMFNDHSWGGYIIFKTYPERKVFIDNRNQLYEKDIFKKYARAVFLPKDWEKLDKEFDFDYALVRNEYPIGEFLKLYPDWKIVYRDELASIFVKQKNSKN